MKNKQILITGASGFIGSFLVEQALKEDFDTCAGVRSTSSRSFLQDEKIQFVDLPFHNKQMLKESILRHVELHGKWNYIIHNAGITKSSNPGDFDKINYSFTVNLIEALQETGNVPEKFILMSSLSACHPETKYGRSKWKAEQYLFSTKNFPFIIMRPTGVYGPREKDYLMMMKTVKSGLDVSAGLKEQLLTFIYVTDLVQAVFLALKSPFFGKIYQVTDGKIYSDKEYTQILKEALGKKRVLRIKIPLWLLYIVSALCGGISKLTGKASTLNTDKYKIMRRRDWTCDFYPLFNDLSFTPEYDLQKGVQASVKWYRENGWL